MRRQSWPRRGLGEIGHDEAEDGERDDDAEKSVRALQIVVLLAWRSPPTRSERPTIPLRIIITTANSVSRTSVGLLAPCSITAEMLITSTAVTEGQYQRPVRLAEPLGQRIGVAYDGERRGKDDAKKPEKDEREPKRIG